MAKGKKRKRGDDEDSDYEPTTNKSPLPVVPNKIQQAFYQSMKEMDSDTNESESQSSTLQSGKQVVDKALFSKKEKICEEENRKLEQR